MLSKLSEHERRILRFIEKCLRESSIAPTFEEIRQGVKLASKDHVSRDLKRLAAKGFIELIPRKARGIRLLRTVEGWPFSPTTFHVPLLGTIAAGEPIPVPQESSSPLSYEVIELTRAIVKDQGDIYALKVKGDSMIDALINDGDIVIMHHQARVENGEMAAVWLTDRQETTLKRFYHEGDRVRLQPENRHMKPIFVSPQQVEIQGKVIAVIRQT